MNKKFLDGISGMSIFMAKLFTETLNHIGTCYDTFFNFNKLGYSLNDIQLVRWVVVI